ncbi:MAG: permease-like cell division protein FtsX [Oscillospiraceae bacterium]|nr:permease-like cell division protein FtsX [Oscillospiraceae bacterium]
MRKYSVIFFIKQSLNGLFMNSIMSITSIFILTACLVLTGCFALLSFNTNINLQQLDKLNKIVFFIDKEYESEEQIEKIKEEIRNLANVESIKLVSKEEALNIVREKYMEFADVFEEEDFYNQVLKDNYIENSIEIEYKNIEDVGTLDYQLRCTEGVAKYNDGTPKVKNQVEIAKFIDNLKNVVMLVLIGFSLILFVIAVFIILNTVKLSVHARKNEIEIMRYIGATNFFIVFPFLLEGIIIGVISGLIAYVAQSYIYGSAVNAIIKMNAGLEFILFSDVSVTVFLGFIFTGVLCGLFGSGISSRRYLKT